MFKALDKNGSNFIGRSSKNEGLYLFFNNRRIDDSTISIYSVVINQKQVEMTVRTECEKLIFNFIGDYKISDVKNMLNYVADSIQHNIPKLVRTTKI